MKSNNPSAAKKTKIQRTRGNAEGPPPAGMVMDHMIWQELDEDLLEEVIARLPIPTFFRLRSVCQKWSSLLHSHSFSQRWAEASQRQPWFFTTLTYKDKCAAMYDPSIKKWHRCIAPPSLLFLRLIPEASVGGLICFLHVRTKHYHVGNPLTQTWKSVRLSCYASVGMVLNQDYSASRGFKLVCTENLGRYEVYDSLTRTIRERSTPAEITLPLSFLQRTMTSDNVVYFLRKEPDGIVSYDLASETWEQILIPAPPNTGYNLTLAECRGRILLVGLVQEDGEIYVRVWEAKTRMNVWNEIGVMPISWCSKFRGKNTQLICSGNRGLLMMVLRCPRMNRIFTYDVTSKEWSQVPECFLPHDTSRRLIEGVLAFFPSP